MRGKKWEKKDREFTQQTFDEAVDYITKTCLYSVYFEWNAQVKKFPRHDQRHGTEKKTKYEEKKILSDSLAF